MCRAICESLGYMISFPDTEAELVNEGKMWSADPCGYDRFDFLERYCHGVMYLIYRCVGAVDGTHIPFRCHKLKKANENQWFCYKQFPSTNVMVIVGADGCFRSVCVGNEGCMSV